MIKYGKLKKEEVFMQLYKYAKVNFPIKGYEYPKMTLFKAKQLLENQKSFMFYEQRAIMVDLSKDWEFDEKFYDSWNGEGVAQMAIDEAIITKLEESYYSSDI